MNAEEILIKLKAEFPGKRVVCLPETDPDEIIVEIDPEGGVAIAVIDRSVPHFHSRMTEVYEVQEGTLKVYVNDRPHVLAKGQSIKIEPNQVHWAEGKATRLIVRSSPPWSAGDHFLVESGKPRPTS